jgi:ankyrin repeat protein
MDGVNVNCYEDDAMVTPLHHSVAANNHHMTLLLLNFGANPLLSDSDGQSAFQMSVHSSDDTIVRMIGYFLSTQPPAL